MKGALLSFYSGEITDYCIDYYCCQLVWPLFRIAVILLDFLFVSNPENSWRVILLEVRSLHALVLLFMPIQIGLEDNPDDTCTYCLWLALVCLAILWWCPFISFFIIVLIFAPFAIMRHLWDSLAMGLHVSFVCMHIYNCEGVASVHVCIVAVHVHVIR